MRIAPRALTPAQEHAVRQLAANGVRPAILAGNYGISVRTVYRIIGREPLETVEVRVGSYHAMFEIHELGPIQRTDWRAA